MKIDANNLDSLCKLVRNLECENRRLKEQLKKANIAFETTNVFEEKIEDSKEFDPDQGERIINMMITEKHAKYFFWMFWGRKDVYAKRGKNGGYFTQCVNRWNNRLCPKQKVEKKNVNYVKIKKEDHMSSSNILYPINIFSIWETTGDIIPETSH